MLLRKACGVCWGRQYVWVEQEDGTRAEEECIECGAEGWVQVPSWEHNFHALELKVSVEDVD